MYISRDAASCFGKKGIVCIDSALGVIFSSGRQKPISSMHYYKMDGTRGHAHHRHVVTKPVETRPNLKGKLLKYFQTVLSPRQKLIHTTNCPAVKNTG